MQRPFRYFCPGEDQAHLKPRQAYGQFSTLQELEKAVRARPKVQGLGEVDILLHDAYGYPTSMHVGTASVPDGIPVLEVRQILGMYKSLLPAPHSSPLAHVMHLLEHTQVFARACWSFLPLSDAPPTPKGCNQWVVQYPEQKDDLCV